MRTRSSMGVVRLVAMLAVAVAAGRDALAEEAAALEVGGRIRVVQHGAAGSLTGRLAEMNADGLILDTQGHRVRIPFSQLRTLQVSDGRERSKAAFYGGLVGFAIGFLPLAGSLDDECWEGSCVPFVLLVAGSVGAVGAMMGSLAAPERWHDVDWRPPAANLDLSDRLRVGISPGREGGLRFSASLRF